MRYFNTAGPCIPERHYMVPPEPRLPEARGLIDREQYFVVHAPRQTGKTTTLKAIARRLTAEGKYLALHFSGETGEPAGDNYAAAQRAVLSAIADSAENQELPAELLPPTPWPNAPAERMLLAGLSEWSQQCPRPLVLFFDEIDALQGESLRSVLRQLRDGHNARPAPFPASVVLCGLHDVRDYKAASGGNPHRLGTASPFNIKVESLRLGDFTEDEVRALYAQHTTETGQEYTEGAQLVIMAFVHRLVNGGGFIDREYGVGRGRIDLVVRWPYHDADGKRVWQREAMELKVWRPGRQDPMNDGLRQLDEYLDRLGLDRGTLVVFDRRPDAPPLVERTRFSENRTPTARPVTLLRA